MTELRDTFGLEAMKAELIRDEGLVLEVYKDPGSGFAVGVGRNLTTQGLNREECAALGISNDMAGPGKLTELNLTNAQAMTLLVNDITDRAHQLDTYLPWWRLLSQARQRVLLNMAFEMGTHGLVLRMGPMVELLQRGKFEDAANYMEGCPWGREVPKRPHELAQMMRLDKIVNRAGEPDVPDAL